MSDLIYICAYDETSRHYANGPKQMSRMFLSASRKNRVLSRLDNPIFELAILLEAKRGLAYYFLLSPPGILLFTLLCVLMSPLDRRKVYILDHKLSRIFSLYMRLLGAEFHVFQHDLFSLNFKRRFKHGRGFRLRLKAQLVYIFERYVEFLVRFCNPNSIVLVSSLDLRFSKRFVNKDIDHHLFEFNLNADPELPPAEGRRTRSIVVNVASNDAIVVSDALQLIEILFQHCLSGATEEVIIFGPGVDAVKGRVKMSTFGSRVKYIDYLDDYWEVISNCSIYFYPRNTGAGLHTKIADVVSVNSLVISTHWVKFAFAETPRNFISYKNVDNICHAIPKLLTTDFP